METESIKKQVIVPYLEQYPDLPTLTLARLIYLENPKVFTSIERVRTSLRYYRGAQGKNHLNKLVDRRFLRDLQAPYNPFKLPESDEKEFEPFIIPEVYKKLLVFGDAHIPYHNVDSLSYMIEYALKQKVDSILLNGDIIDFYGLSVFVKDPRNRHFTEELELVKQFLNKLKEIFSVKIFYKQGNHEERLENYLRVKAPELIGTKEFTLNSLLELEEKDITLIKDKRTIKFEKLNILHGHELKGSIIPPVNAARGVFLKTKENTLVNHFHTDSKHSSSTLDKSYISCWAIGSMCELHPEYAPNNEWSHGFAIVERQQNNFVVSTKQVINNTIL